MRSALCLVTCLVAVLVLGGDAPRWSHAMASPSLIPDARLVSVSTKSFASLATDLYWVKTIAVATTAKQAYEARSIIEWANFVTDLEPTFLHAYLMGGLLGTMPMPDLSIANADEAEKLLSKGQANLPKQCPIAVYRAYLLTETHQPRAAAEVLATASRAPDNNCPDYAAPLAIRLFAASGEFEAASAFTEALVKESNGDEQDLFRKRLRDLEVEHALQAIDAAYKRFEQQFGKPPADVSVLVGAGFIDAAVLSGIDEPIVFYKGEARLASGAPRLKPFTHQEIQE